MSATPTFPRAIAFIDGQNLYHAAKDAFGYTYPNYDVYALAAAVCAGQGWVLEQVRFYTGIPDAIDNPFWHRFWQAKLPVIGRAGASVFSRPLRYRNRQVTLPDGSPHIIRVGEEKGIDVRLAIDVIRLAHRGAYDVAVLFTQDQDLSEVAEEIRSIADEQQRWIKMASAFPSSPARRSNRGVNKTDWIRIDRATYDACIDPRDYRR